MTAERIPIQPGEWYFSAGPTIDGLTRHRERLMLLVHAYREGLTRRAIIDEHAPIGAMYWAASPWIGWELRAGDVTLARVWIAQDGYVFSVRFEWIGEEARG